MKVKLSQLKNAIPSLNILASTKLNFRASYDISKRLRIINSELEDLEKLRVDKLQELSGNLIEDNKYVLGDNKEKFEREMEELLNDEIDIDLIPLKQELFAEISIEPMHLVNLNFLIADEAEVKTAPVAECESEHK